ncbi:MauE/DoxX family redox-associated membrane protein [Zoogloea sp.]|uniref:MauE/DoxX family redox-associated membrane protein n=1 Tax=Zoogloea sp. TaxID=49181 RepID=UPI0014157193|nr:MAG: methylamine utilization protein MauE [Zoogloea sp.]
MDAWPIVFDPVPGHACAAALAILLLSSAWRKLADLEVFRATVELYALLPVAAVAAFAGLFPLFEVAAGVVLLLRPDGPWMVLPFAVLGLSTAAILVNVLRGRSNLECGCGGDRHPRLSWALVMRNGALLGGVLMAAAADNGRPLVWVDFLSVAALTLALAGLYATLNQLLANRPESMPTGSLS